MCVDDQVRAEHLLARLNYYRLSGYWYPMRRFTLDTGIAKDKFVDGASFDLVVALYEFDERLRHCVFIELDRVEMAVRAMLGYELGRIDPLVYLDATCLGARARQQRQDGRSVHDVWLSKYESALKSSKEDFVTHHKSNYRGAMPIWAAGGGGRPHGQSGLERIAGDGGRPPVARQGLTGTGGAATAPPPRRRPGVSGESMTGQCASELIEQIRLST